MGKIVGAKCQHEILLGLIISVFVVLVALRRLLIFEIGSTDEFDIADFASEIIFVTLRDPFKNGNPCNGDSLDFSKVGFLGIFESTGKLFIIIGTTGFGLDATEITAGRAVGAGITAAGRGAAIIGFVLIGLPIWFGFDDDRLTAAAIDVNKRIYLLQHLQ